MFGDLRPCHLLLIYAVAKYPIGQPLAGLMERLEAAFSPLQIWLFGSRARGDARTNRDWDLLLVVPDETRSMRFHPLMAWRIQREAGVYADVVLVKESDFAQDAAT